VRLPPTGLIPPAPSCPTTLPRNAQRKIVSWRVFGRCLSVTAALHPLPVGARKRSGRQTVSNHAQCDGGYHDIEQHAVQTREPVFVKQKEIDDRGKAAGSKPADKPPRGCPSAAPEHAERHCEQAHD